MPFEVELKFKIKSRSELNDRLRRLGAVFLNKEKMTDYYLNSEVMDFKNTDRALRIRDTDLFEGAELTYKGPKLSKESKTREEINIRIDSHENMVHILEVLGLEIVAEVKKTRENWTHTEYTISIDNVEKLGYYVEIESIVESRDEVEPKVNELKAYAIQLGIRVEQQIRKGYLDLIQEASEQ